MMAAGAVGTLWRPPICGWRQAIGTALKTVAVLIIE
jgi:hypothetical protein